MAEDRNILQKIISPTKEEKEKLIKTQDLGQKMMQRMTKLMKNCDDFIKVK